MDRGVTGVEVQKAGADAAEAWRAIRLEALGTAPEAFSAKLTDWRNRPLADFTAQLEANPTFLAYAGDAPVGCVAWRRDRDCPDRAWIEAVFVSVRARGGGIAQLLISEAMGDARAAGMREIWLEVGASNAAAQATYRRAGFAAVSDPDRPSPSRGACEISMWRALD